MKVIRLTDSEFSMLDTLLETLTERAEREEADNYEDMATLWNAINNNVEESS